MTSPIQRSIAKDSSLTFNFFRKDLQMKDIREFMRVCTLKFGWINKEDLGYFDYDKCEVKLNVALLLIETFVHEQNHWKHPKASEKEVIKMTCKQMNRMSRKDMSEIGVFIFNTFKNEVKNFIKRKAGKG